MAYKISGGIRFNIVVNTTDIELSYNDVYSNTITRNKDMVDKCDMLITQENNRIIFKSGDDYGILYI